MLYDVLVYPYQFQSKEHAQKSVGIVKNNILKYPRSMTIEEIANACIDGQVIAFCHAERTGTSKSFCKECWQYQRLYAFDFDNSYVSTVGRKKEKKKFDRPYYMTWQDALAHAKRQGFSPAFIYTSGSHQEDWHRFRMVFVLDTEVTSVLMHEKVEKAFITMFSVDDKTVLDKSCADPSRIFYPGKQLTHQDYDATVSLSKLLETYPYDKQHHIQCAGEPKNVEVPTACKAQTAGCPEEIQLIIEEIQNKQKARKIASKSLRDRVAVGLKAAPPIIGKNNNNSIKLFYAEMEKPVSPTYITLPEEFDAFCYQIDLSELLNLPLDKEFNCILPGHEDSTASARIVWHNDRYKYRCFGCDSTYDIFGLLERLSGCSRTAVMDWICSRFNVRYETEWQRLRKEEIQFYHDYLVMNLKADYPYLYKELAKSGETAVLNMFLDIARIHLLDRAWAGMNNPAFIYSLSNFCQKMEYYGLAKGKDSLHKNIVHLARLGLIEILNKEQIPPRMMSLLESYRKANKQRYRTSCYAVPVLTQDLLENAQEVIKNDKRLSIRKTYQCREQCIRSEGKDKADSIFVQSSNTESNEKLDTFYKRYKGAAERLLEKKGWTTEDEIINRLKGFTKAQKAKGSGICLPQLLRELQLLRIPFTKALEEEYSIKSRKKLRYGASKIIIRE